MIGNSILAASVVLNQLSRKLKELYLVTKDQRCLRAELMLEELSEVLEAMGDADELALLDGIADLIYVVVGTGTTFDLPVTDAFYEVHRSNMTKHKAAADHQGDKGKGADYVPPNLGHVLKCRRTGLKRCW